MKELEEMINSRKPIKVFLKDETVNKCTYLGIYEYNDKLKRYERFIGNIALEKMALYLAGDESMSHIKLEVLYE